MERVVLTLVLSFIISCAGLSQDLTVVVKNIKPLKGDLYVSIHREAKGFLNADSAFARQKIAIKAHEEQFLFKNLPAGKMAVAIYHDENRNGVMDANEIGVPREGYGFSNNPKSPGRPKFDQAAFEFSGKDTLEIKMIYHPVPPPKQEKK